MMPHSDTPNAQSIKANKERQQKQRIARFTREDAPGGTDRGKQHLCGRRAKPNQNSKLTIRSGYNITCVCWLSKVISTRLSEDIANALRNHSDRLLRHAPATKENCPKSLLQYKIILAARCNCGRMTSNWSQTFRRMSPPGFVQQRTAKAVA